MICAKVLTLLLIWVALGRKHIYELWGWELSVHKYVRLSHVSRELYDKWVANHFINGWEEINIVAWHSAFLIGIYQHRIIMPLYNRVICNILES